MRTAKVYMHNKLAGYLTEVVKIRSISSPMMIIIK
jgi:ribosomal protein S17E